MNEEYERFSRIGFIFVMIGGVLGLGNIWRFPYLAGEYGGTFVILYIAMSLCLSLPLIIAETLIGKMTHKEPISAFDKLAPAKKKYWRWIGLQFITPLFALTFYWVVLCWVFIYLIYSIFTLPDSGALAKDLFTDIVKNDAITQLIYHAIIVFLTSSIVLCGLHKGIERANRILIPLAFFIILFLLAYAIATPSFTKALSFMFAPDFSNLSINVVLAAIGQAFFSMSLGMAVFITYSFESTARIKTWRSSVVVTIVDILVSIAAGIIIFTFLFNENLPLNQGSELVFASIPSALASFDSFGQILTIAFFAVLLLSALACSISLLEPATSFLVQRFGWRRDRAILLPLLLAYLMSMAVLFSNVNGYEFLSVCGKSLFEFSQFLTVDIMMPIGAFFTAFFIGFIANREEIAVELKKERIDKKAIAVWFFMIRYFAPILIFATFVTIVARVVWSF
ncbi:MAG: sodium-dependent transporter [Helicobacteraceae bacterium]|jgi:NSS family neurotransmitter:Na+ symporter|nr:sodium-dependent transporter [Helicobacteraceae bacterium]